MELGDLVRRSGLGMFPPRVVNGEVIKVNPKTVVVRWKNRTQYTDVVLSFWHRGKTREVPATSYVAHRNLELIERKGGPW